MTLLSSIKAQLTVEETCPATVIVEVHPVYLSTVIEHPGTFIYLDQVTVEVENAPTEIILETFVSTTITVTVAP